MTIKVRVIPGSKKQQIMVFEQGLKVYLREPALEGRANKKLIEVLADYYNVRKYSITIVKGQKQRDKIIEINEAA